MPGTGMSHSLTMSAESLTDWHRGTLKLTSTAAPA